jgi:hypothetical protein
MIKAIQSCPHQKYSGINLDDKVVSCQVFDPLNEDLYFGTVLRGIKAPLPSAFEASLFSLEMLWPEQSIDIYGGPKDYSKQRNMHQDFLGTDSHSSSSSLSLPIYQGVLHKEKYYTVPAGIHKAWKYHEYDLLLSADVLNQCPLLEFIVPPNQYLDAENDVPNEESLEWAITVADVNDDALIDIIIGNAGQSNQLLLNNGLVYDSFQGVEVIDLPGDTLNTHTVSTADVNGDDWDDITRYNNVSSNNKFHQSKIKFKTSKLY